MKQLTSEYNILVVDDAPGTRELFERHLKGEGYLVESAGSVKEALAVLERVPVDLVITDLRMPRENGIDLIRYVRENIRDTEVIMVTGYASIESAVEAIKVGAEEFLSKPVTNEELLLAVRKALNKLELRRAGHLLPTTDPKTHFGLIGESPEMQKVFSLIAKAAATQATVLVTGECGTGKELVARAVHYGSPWASSSFVPVNCGGIPEGLLESELFGHVRGAFTGASESRDGLFQSAHGGSIFLDEVGDTSPAMQTKLLRVLQDKEVSMVGSDRPRKINVRVLAASNKDLRGLVEKGLFREDLFYRLNVIKIALPPLSKRKEDVLLLAAHFAKKYSGDYGKTTPAFSDGVLQIFSTYFWPGNVRELENLVMRLVIMGERKVIDVPDLPPHMRFSLLKGSGPNRTLAEMECEHIRNVLRSVEGNKSHAARLLGVDRKTLRAKMKRFGIS